jgi:hypothetical protein
MSTVDQRAEDGRAARDAALRTVFEPGTLVWIVDEQLEPVGPTWRVTLVYQGALQGRWMRRAYRYDIPSGTLHFGGEQPIGEAELAAARRGGRRF